jgi:hypothetical protein
MAILSTERVVCSKLKRGYRIVLFLGVFWSLCGLAERAFMFLHVMTFRIDGALLLSTRGPWDDYIARSTYSMALDMR